MLLHIRAALADESYLELERYCANVKKISAKNEVRTSAEPHFMCPTDKWEDRVLDLRDVIVTYLIVVNLWLDAARL